MSSFLFVSVNCAKQRIYVPFASRVWGRYIGPWEIERVAVLSRQADGKQRPPTVAKRHVYGLYWLFGFKRYSGLIITKTSTVYYIQSV
jgi:hypothetical protein